MRKFNILFFVNGYNLSRSHKSICDGHLTEKNKGKITQRINYQANKPIQQVIPITKSLYNDPDPP